MACRLPTKSCNSFVLSFAPPIGPSMRRSLHRSLMVLLCLSGVPALPVVAQELSAHERSELEAWYRRTSERTPNGQWGISIGTMDGRLLWSVSPQLELVPASTTKLFTTGFSR